MQYNKTDVHKVPDIEYHWRLILCQQFPGVNVQ